LRERPSNPVTKPIDGFGLSSILIQASLYEQGNSVTEVGKLQEGCSDKKMVSGKEGGWIRRWKIKVGKKDKRR
jgi:hypothetical protein